MTYFMIENQNYRTQVYKSLTLIFALVGSDPKRDSHYLLIGTVRDGKVSLGNASKFTESDEQVKTLRRHGM